MSEIWEGIKHFATTKWEFISYLFLIILAALTKIFPPLPKELLQDVDINGFSLRKVIGEAASAWFWGWCALLAAQELQPIFGYGDKVTVLCVALGAYKGVDTLRVIDKILEKRFKDEDKQ